ncbi:hypothetical protein HU200_014380 [Digitaria exilis]|uniref:Uncharacterized protein n=1 Tax=Digitaria exilis TaxID=1010633 RepID=A0A835AYQ0_9POAL|nr:hypothetical protein HU200_047794 [Digitaria exilis]KAF8736135.1 hypothetical protein HU200_014380 [Digitaria exilis]
MASMNFSIVAAVLLSGGVLLITGAAARVPDGPALPLAISARTAALDPARTFGVDPRSRSISLLQRHGVRAGDVHDLRQHPGAVLLRVLLPVRPDGLHGLRPLPRRQLHDHAAGLRTTGSVASASGFMFACEILIESLRDDDAIKSGLTRA